MRNDKHGRFCLRHYDSARDRCSANLVALKFDQLRPTRQVSASLFGWQDNHATPLALGCAGRLSSSQNAAVRTVDRCRQQASALALGCCRVEPAPAPRA
eukprot:601376-Prymnesium_polylepis.1